ncbi:MAG: hypothetical protein LHV68_08790 [Elusimicrobia bacterium]|nr:hypothetical protein [Candidatus Liberimonas magnetica]
MHKGFYFKELRVVGKNVKPAKLSFNKGLNVLQGASDTGKSYVFTCINYVLGSNKEPNKIKEAEGYDEIRLNLCTYDNRDFTISRKFGDSKIYVAQTVIDNFDKVSTNKLNSIHSSKSDDNISYFLLSLIGLEGKKMSVNARNEKRIISFRDIANLCLINEELIISTISPIYSGQVINKTVEESVFKLILSGKDDDELESLEDPKIYKNKIKGKIEFIEESIVSKSKILDELSKRLQDLELENINLMIDEFTKLINESHNNVIEEEKKRADVWKEIESLKSQITQIDELEKRFNLLSKHYKSDVDRLEFINEGKQFIDQLQDISCPICGSQIKQDVLDKYEKNNTDSIIKSLVSESNNIKLKQKELIDTLEQLNNQKDELGKQLKSRIIEYHAIDKYIINKLNPISKINRKKLEEYLNLKEDKSRVMVLNEEINQLTRDKKYYSAKLEEKVKKIPGRSVPNELYDLFSDDIKKYLAEWGLHCNKVYFDKTENDIEIDDKPRSHCGKGFRAIYQSAFMVGLMDYCLTNNKFHPFFLVLDSPLTTYKEQDKDNIPKDDKVPQNIQELFYKSLSKYGKDSDFQIFILENKDPELKIKKLITYEHFSKNENVDRYGFFPLREQSKESENE